jgi:hypothetical protein
MIPDIPSSKKSGSWNPFDAAVAWGGAALAMFVLAALAWPGGGYNPFMRMLSALGRTMVRGVEWPWCHYFFMAGMFLSIGAVVSAAAGEIRRFSGWRRHAAGWGLALNAAGLATIALVPENANIFCHNVGCWCATLGGVAMLVARDRPGRDRAWTIVLAVDAALFGTVIALHATKVLRFAPYVPTLQKSIIVLFSIWMLDSARHRPGAHIRRRTWALLTAVFALVALRVVVFGPHPWGMHMLHSAGFQVPPLGNGQKPSPESQRIAAPFSNDERAALAWLDHVTGQLSTDEEREWWGDGGRQFGLSSKRYHIAFCGYAAAALGWRGGTEERAVAARILGNCIDRIIRRDVWSYSMSKSYWGLKPWAPDPCWRENVMYTGHLLQLLALYETFSGDKRYWMEGWDFVWTDGRRVHYTVRKLIDVTVFQMRKGPGGGISCEPGLIFFPCNNHPHIALALFSALGHGNWTADARRWERWALAHYVRPSLGGGALNLAYHARSNMLYPRGHNGLDGWSLLWYEPWAKDRNDALALWREAAARIDWKTLENNPDSVAEFDACRNPAAVPASSVAPFLAAAARACDDRETAERLEAITDRKLVRKDGMYYLDISRDWRVGATAIRIISLAEANGFSLREKLAAAPGK